MTRFDTLEAATAAAAAATAAGETTLAVDRGRWTSPRYGTVTPPKVGDAVSYAFNGDYYPDGHVTHVTAGTCRIVKTDTGSVYYRRKQTGGWLMTGGTWRLVAGHVSKYNRSF